MWALLPLTFFFWSCSQALGSQMWNNSRVVTVVPIWAGDRNEWKNMGKSKNNSTDFNYSKYFGGLWVYDCRTEETGACQTVRELIREDLEDLFVITVECFGYFCIHIYIKSLFLNEVLDFGCSSLVVLHFPSLSTQLVFVLFKEFVLTNFVVMTPCLCSWIFWLMGRWSPEAFISSEFWSVTT